MAIEGRESIEIDAPIDAVYAVAADVEHLPRWQHDITAVEVIERDADGQQVLVDTATDAKVRTLRSRLRFSYTPPTEVRWRQESGDVKELDGTWTFEDLGDGRTRATYWMRVDLGRVLSLVIRGPIVGVLRGQLVDSMPAKLKADVEG